MTLRLEVIEAYDSVRPIADKPFRSMCYAPFNSMFFDTFGKVRACCANYRYTLGDLTKERLDDIWSGTRIRKFREAMNRYDLSLGCEVCEWQMRDGNFYAEGRRASAVHALKFDTFPVEPEDQLWPTNLEFNLHNTCNLECVMCSGEFSSLIRTRREKQSPLPRAYKEEFFNDLRKYLPHVKSAQFLGGEPFLIVEHFRVWDMMIELCNLDCCGVTTNGTVYNDKVERVLDSLPIAICMSMDGITKETYEKIRVNASHDLFMTNFQRFNEYSRAHSRTLNINYAISRFNWMEFADVLLFAESNNATVTVCPVVQPREMSLVTLPQEELGGVVDALHRRDAELRNALKLNLPVWVNYLESLGHRIENADRSFYELDLHTNSGGAEPVVVDSITQVDANRSIEPLEIVSHADLDRLYDSNLYRYACEQIEPWTEFDVQLFLCNDADRIVAFPANTDSLLGLNIDFVGRSTNDIFAALMSRYGSHHQAIDLRLDADLTEQVVWFGDEGPDRLYLRVVTFPRTDADGQIIGRVRVVGRRVGSLGPVELPVP
jgi:radical SAM protein with 4Fe4S-binding SPASM domain